MEYISKFKCSEIDSMLTDLRNSVKPQVTALQSSVKEINEELESKQATINDLEDIREGASKGATAIQEVKTINGESIVGSGDIIIKGGNGSGPNIVTLNGDEVCDYYAINKSGEHVLASGYGCTHYIDCYGCGTMDITLIQNTSSINYGLAFYDANKKFISFVASKVGSEKKGVVTTVTIPENAHYFRTTYFNFENQKTYGDFACALTYDTSIVSADGKRKYQDGFIYFSQRVNQSVTKYWSTDQTVANDGNLKVTTGVLALPTTYKNTGRKTPLILYAHGLSHYVYYGTWGATETFPIQKQHWLDMGFAVMDCNGARDNNRSGKFASGICPQGINAYKLCVEYVQEHYNVSDDIFIVAGSAGGAVGWNFLSMYGKCVKAAVFLSAYSNMKSDAYGAGGQQSRYVEFLGFDDASTYEVDKTIGFDPALKIVDISGKKYCFDYYNTPIYAIYGSLDTYTLVTSMKNLIAALRNAGATAQIRRIEGVGHEIVSGANLMVDTEVGNWLLSHYRAMGEGAEIVYHIVTYKYVDEDGSEIKASVTANVMDGVTIDFAAKKESISGYEYVSTSPANATVTSNITVIHTYKKVVEPDEPVIPDEPEIEGEDLSSLFTWDRQSWMAISQNQGELPSTFKSSTNFMSCFTDLSAYVGKTIRVTVPQYTNSAGSVSSGRSLWFTQPSESNNYAHSIIKEWDKDTNGNGKGILVEVETVVPAEAPYMWTSTYMDGVAAYVGPNSGLIDFRCYVVGEGGDTPDTTTHTLTYQYKDTEGNVIKEQTTAQIANGTALNFENVAPTINGYELVSVEPTSGTITSDMVVVFTYQKQDAPIEGNDLSSLFTFDRKNWMCVANPQFKQSSYFDSGYTDLSAYIGKTIRITVPQYTASNGASSTGITFWTATPTEQPASVDKSLIIKQWDTHDAGKAKGILVEVETVVPENAPYIWTSTYNDNAVSLGVYVGENDGYTDFKCYIVE